MRWDSISVVPTHTRPPGYARIGITTAVVPPGAICPHGIELAAHLKGDGVLVAQRAEQLPQVTSTEPEALRQRALMFTRLIWRAGGPGG